MADADLNTLMQEIRELRERLDDGPGGPATFQTNLPPVIIKKDIAKSPGALKPTKFPIYNGDKTTYPAWRRAVLSILKMDWNTFGYTDSRVFLMIYKALDGKAQKQAGSYFESGGLGGLERPEDFIEFLDRSNWDATRISRARSELNELKMGPKQRWNSFFPSWANKLTEAQGDNWPDETKITMLKGTLNQTLRIALASNHLLPENDFHEWVKIVSRIAQQYDELTKGSNPIIDHGRYNNNNNRHQSINVDKTNNSSLLQQWPRSDNEQHFVGDLDSTGDTIMGGINHVGAAAGGKRRNLISKWKSPEQIERLRKERKCYRCERRGCNTKICPLGPAEKPKNNRDVYINIADLSGIDPSLYIDKTENKSEEGNNESEN